LERSAKLYRFRKKERLGSEKLIAKLFAEGKRIRCGCLQLIFSFTAEANPPIIQVLISAPKKRIRKAVLRNLIKRRMREAWRLNKLPLQKALVIEGKKLCLALVYNTDEISEYERIDDSMIKVIIRLLDLLETGK
jgi:ribonuclease P protein component